MSSVQIDLELVTSSFKTALADVEKNTASFAKTAESSFSSVGQSFNIMAGNLAAAGIQKALGFIISSLGSVVDEAIQTEEAVNALNIALKSSNKYTQAASKDMLDFAQALSDVTVYDDELITQNQALLLSMTNLSIKGVNQATKAAADLASTMHIDLGTATTMIAKAIEGNTIGFQKMGIHIASGKTEAERLTNVLAALSKQQGAAEAQTNTYSGAVAQSKNAFSNLLSTLGEIFVTDKGVINSLQEKTAAFKSADEWVKNNRASIDQFIESLKISIPIILGVASTVGVISLGFTGMATAASAAWAAITGPVALVVAGVAAITTATYLLYKNFDTVKATAYNALAATLEFAAKGAGVFGKNAVSEALVQQAQHYRDLAVAIQVTQEQTAASAAANAATENTALLDKQNLAAQAAAAEIASQQAVLEATKQLRDDARLAEAEAQIADNAQQLLREDTQFAALAEKVGLEKAIHLTAQSVITTDRIGQEKIRLETSIAANKKFIDDHANTQKQIEAIEKERIQRQKDGMIAYTAWEEQTQKEKVATTKDTLGQIATLTSSKNAQLFEIGKAAAIANATIDGYLAVQKTLATVPPPFNYAAAAAVGIAAADNVNRISGQSPPKFADGGIVPGTSFSGDRVTAQLNSGEMVLNRSQQSNLFSQINSGGNSAKVEELLIGVIDAIKSTANQVISIDGREIINVVRNGLSSGRSLA